MQDAIILIAKLFEKDLVLDTQVKFDLPIISNYDIGGIKKGFIYDQDKNLRDVLTDLLNPYVGIADVRTKMTPDIIELEWFSDSQGTNPININKILNKE